jgi:UPF0716 family protein affecting phage T7 exclusion
MLFLIGLLLGMVGAVGIVVALFLTNRKLVARYGYGGPKAVAQSERDGEQPKLLLAASRMCAAMLVAGMVLFALAAFGVGQ